MFASLVLLLSPVFLSCRSLCPSDAADPFGVAVAAGAKAPLMALCTVSSDAFTFVCSPDFALALRKNTRLHD